MSLDPATPRPSPSEPRRGLERRVAFEAVRGRLFAGTAPPASPVTLGRFVVTKRVGQGGMGVVYAAYDPRLERKVALKVVRPLSISARAQALLEREAQAAARLGHPNVVTVYECGTADDGSFFIAMELVEGQTLRQWLAAAPRRWPEIVELFAAAGRGLAAAHEARVVHRDFKPDNVLVGRDGRARVVDFGLARSLDAARTSPESTSATENREGSTDASMHDGGTGSTLQAGGGTPAYMAPEQREGKAVGPAADQFALCMALHEALFGALPGATGERPRAEGPRRRVPRALARVVQRGLEPEPERRHASLAVLVEQLEARLRARRRRGWLAAGVLAAGLTGALGHGLAAPEPIDPCADSDARMRESWSPARRERIAARLAELPAPLPARTQALLDEYAQAWSRMRQDSCVATRVRGEQSDALLDLRVACLDRRAYALEGLLTQLEAETSEGLERAAALVPELLPLGVCEAEIVREQQTAANMTRGRTDRTRSPQAEQAWRTAMQGLEDARLQAQLGELELAIEGARGVEQLARVHGLTQLHAEATLLRAHHQLGLDPKAEVRADLERALEQAQAAADSDTGVQCVAELLRLEREQPREDGARKDGDRSVLLAVGQGLAARTHDPARARARLAQQEAALLASRGEGDEATAIYQRALAELEAAGVPDHDSLVMGLSNHLGAALIGSGRHDEAAPVLRTLWRAQQQVLPADAAARAPTALQLGHLARRAGRLDEAFEHYHTAHAIFGAHWGPEHPNTHAAALGLAKIQHRRGQLDEAARIYGEVLAAFERAYGEHAPQLITPLDQLATLERERGRPKEAVAYAARTVAVAEAAMGARKPLTAGLRINLGRALLAAGDVDEAIGQLTSAYDVLQAPDANPEWRGEASLFLARALHAKSAAHARVRPLIVEAHRALSSVADRDVVAAAALEELRRFAAAAGMEAGVGTP